MAFQEPSVNDTTPNDALSDFNNTDDTYLNDSNTIGLSLEGSMSITHTDLEVNDESNDLEMTEITTDRQYGFATLRPTYYIKAKYDINNHVTFQPGPQGCDANDPNSAIGNDDSWGLSAITITDTDPANSGVFVEYGLPRADATYDVASFTVNDPTGTRSKEYTVDLRIQLANDGSVHANASLPDAASFTGVVDDDYHLAQEAYWPTNGHVAPSAPGANDDDVLAATITSAEVATHFSTEMGLMESDINDQSNVLSQWTISVSQIDNHPGSTLSQYGQVNNRTSDTLFVEGAKVVAQTPKEYHVKVAIEHGNVESLVKENVYGILEQDQTSTLTSS